MSFTKAAYDAVTGGFQPIAALGRDTMRGLYDVQASLQAKHLFGLHNPSAHPFDPDSAANQPGGLAETPSALAAITRLKPPPPSRNALASR